MLSFLSLIRSERIIILFVAALFLFFSYFPLYQNYKHAPLDRFYAGSTDYPLDMMGNLASVQEGYNGHFLRFSKSTSTIESPGTFMKFEYILIGHIARIFRGDTLVVFHLTRVIISILFIFFIYKLVRFAFKEKVERIVAFTLSLFGGGILPAISNQTLRILLELPAEAHIFQRLTTSAHHYMLGSFFALASLSFLARFFDDSKKKYFVLSSVFGFIASFVYAPSVILVLASIPFFFVLRLWLYKEERKRKKIFQTASLLLLYMFFLVIPILYLLYVSQFWEFNTFIKTEKLIPSDINFINYSMLVGTPFILSLFTIPKILREKKSLFLLFLPWIFLHPLFILLMTQFLSMNKFRFFFTPYYLIFALLATVGITVIVDWIGKNIRKISYSVGLLLFLPIVLFPSKHAYVMSYSLNHACFCMLPGYDYAYPKKEIMDAIYWLRDHTKENDTVLSGYFAGILIPAFAGNSVYTSWWFRLAQPPNFNPVMFAYENFYSERMKSEEALQFLKREKITYIFLGSEERAIVPNRGDLQYSFLKEVTRSGNTLVYEITQ